MDRITRSREAGAKLPKNTLSVTRGTHFGNYIGKNEPTRRKQVEAFQNWIWKYEQMGLRSEFIDRCEHEGIEHIACWCKKDEMCHGDVWLDIWNNRIQFADPYG